MHEKMCVAVVWLLLLVLVSGATAEEERWLGFYM